MDIRQIVKVFLVLVAVVGVIALFSTRSTVVLTPPVAPANAVGGGGNVVQKTSERVDTKQAGGAVDKPQAVVKTYKLKGIVRKIEKESGQVMIRHEEIPGYMKAMTMPFDLKGQEVLGELFPGDEVEGELVVKADDIELKGLVITNPAPPASIKFGPNGVEVQAKPVTLIAGEMVPEFKFMLQDGKPAKLGDYRGKLVVLTFIYTRCPLPNFCPMMDRKFGELAARLAATGKGEAVRMLSISFDPEHDTPEALAKHAAAKGAKMPLWAFGVATHEELGKFGPLLGLTYGPGEKEVIHNLVTAVIGPDGTLLRLDQGSAGGAWTVDDMNASLIKALGAKLNNELGK
ncbi:MAG: SCO family protein [Isosphaeraceae bacterium]